MSYTNDYSDDFQSEHFDDISEQYSIKDAVLNDLIRISKGNNIKALRQYINLHKRDLKEHKTRLLNNVVPLDGYKFVRRDDKLMIIKFGTAKPSQIATPVANVAEIAAEPKETRGSLFFPKISNLKKKWRFSEVYFPKSIQI